MDNFVKSQTQNFPSENIFIIPPLTENIVERLKNIPTKKATGLDGISVHILKEVLPAITFNWHIHVYNTSINESIFPDAFKLAKVSPLYKKESTVERIN